MVRRNDKPIKLFKVKAHMGIVGNELADEAANEAVNKIRAGTDIPMCDAPAYTPHHNMYWPTVPIIPTRSMPHPHPTKPAKIPTSRPGTTIKTDTPSAP